MQLPVLQRATLIKRYKRFLADVVLENGKEITVHCPNTGSMTGCAEPGSVVWLSTSDNPKRKYQQTWELAQTFSGHMICVHSAKANSYVKEAVESNAIEELAGYSKITTEVKYGEENSRIDLLLEQDSRRCYVEVKSVTLLSNDDGQGVFPDAVSDRGRKHLRELIAMKEQGHRAVLFFCVLHTGIERVAPADFIDIKYAETFREALSAGVEVLAYRALISPESISVAEKLPVKDRQVV